MLYYSLRQSSWKLKVFFDYFFRLSAARTSRDFWRLLLPQLNRVFDLKLLRANCFSYYCQSDRPNNNNNFKTMFMVSSSWQIHCESSPGSFDECRTASSGRRPKTKPDDLGCESACVQAARIYTHDHHLLLLLSAKADTHFTVPYRIEGWVDLVGWLHAVLVYPPQTVTHPGTNRLWCIATALIEANVLPLSQTAIRW